MISSSASATRSTRVSRAISASSRYSAGMSSSTTLPFSRWRAFMWTTSMTPARQSAEVTRSATQKTPVAVTETLNLA